MRVTFFRPEMSDDEIQAALDSLYGDRPPAKEGVGNVRRRPCDWG